MQMVRGTQPNVAIINRPPGPVGSPGGRPSPARIMAPTWKASATHMTAGTSTSRTPGTQSPATPLPVIPPSTPNNTAPTAGQMTSPARLETR